jgi:hypothetical protein
VKAIPVDELLPTDIHTVSAEDGGSEFPAPEWGMDRVGGDG